MSFFLASTFVTGGNKPVQYAIACTGGVIGSWAIGAFFMMPYLATSQISSVEEQLTGKNHSAMYFAANAVTTSIVGAISGGLIYESIKNIFTTKQGGFFFAENAADAAEHFGVDASQVFNFGILTVPFIVCAVCVLGYFLAFSMPKDFAPSIVAKEFKRFDPSLDISKFQEETQNIDRQEVIFVQVGLAILSGFIFGFIWAGMLLQKAKQYTCQKKNILLWLSGCLIPFGGIFVTLSMHKKLAQAGSEKGVNLKNAKIWLILSGICLPLMGVNVVALAILQSNLNRIYAKEDSQSNGLAG